jgi:hypothetical protein
MWWSINVILKNLDLLTSWPDFWPCQPPVLWTSAVLCLVCHDLIVITESSVRYYDVKNAWCLSCGDNLQYTVRKTWPCGLGVCLQPLDGWCRGFESLWGLGCSFLALCVVWERERERERKRSRNLKKIQLRPELGEAPENRKVLLFKFGCITWVCRVSCQLYLCLGRGTGRGT